MKRGLVVRLISATLLLTVLPVLDGEDPAQAAPRAQSPLPPQPPPAPPPPPVKHPKFTTSIALAAAAVSDASVAATMGVDALASAYPEVQAYFDTGLLRLDSRERLQVYIRVESVTQGVRDALTELGVVLEREDEAGRTVQASVPLGELNALAGLDFVEAVTPPSYGRVNVGSKLTQGDNLLDFDVIRAAQGIDGTGVTVGVISDGIAGLATAIAAGDLPATTLVRVGGTLVSTGGGVIATSFRADGDLEGGLGGPGSVGPEGTAMLEIVHDIAPGAQLRFANFNTDLEFIAAVDYLAANSDVVVDDIGFNLSPYDQTSDVSTNTTDELNRDTNPIRGYYNAVGNEAQRHYQELYVNSGVDGTAIVGESGSFHLFGPTTDTTDCYGTGAGVGNSILVPAFGSIAVELTWDDTWGAATTDYDLYFVDKATGGLITGSTTDNINVTRDPVEATAITNISGSARFLDVYVHNFQDLSPAKTLELFVLIGGQPCPGGTILSYNTVGSSVSAQSDAGGGVLSAGAIYAGDAGTDTIEPFSSRGPTNNGALKPDVTAIDGVAVTGAGGFRSPFFGTSAAAPHLAGLAALLLELRPDLTSGELGDDPAADRTALREAITQSAVDLGAAGADNTFGWGRVWGPGAASALLVPPVVESVLSGQALNEGDTLSNTLASFSDLNSPDAHTATVDWGDGSATEAATVDGAAKEVSGSHTFQQDGAFSVTVTVTDDDGKSASGGFTATVSNLPPAVTAATGLSAFEAWPAMLTLATFVDPGVLDTHTAIVDWGDGSAPTPATVQESGGTGSASAAHAYAVPGEYTGAVAVTDDDGGTKAVAFVVQVAPTPPVPAVGPWGLAGLAVVIAGTFAWRTRSVSGSQGSGPEWASHG